MTAGVSSQKANCPLFFRVCLGEPPESEFLGELAVCLGERLRWALEECDLELSWDRDRHGGTKLPGVRMKMRVAVKARGKSRRKRRRRREREAEARRRLRRQPTTEEGPAEARLRNCLNVTCQCGRATSWSSTRTSARG